jgi:hypothetical protein
VAHAEGRGRAAPWWPTSWNASATHERTFGVQFGVQSERNTAALRSMKPNEHGAHPREHTPTLGLGAGRSQVQILSPRFEKALEISMFLLVSPASATDDGEPTGNKLAEERADPRCVGLRRTERDLAREAADLRRFREGCLRGRRDRGLARPSTSTLGCQMRPGPATSAAAYAHPDVSDASGGAFVLTMFSRRLRLAANLTRPSRREEG